MHHKFFITTQKRGTVDITQRISALIEKAAITHGICHVFLPHTSASLIFCENADPDVRRDLEAFMERLIPDGDPLFSHVAEGADDMPAHVRTILTQNSVSIPIIDGQLALGRWQGIYLWEHRIMPHHRQLIVTLMDAINRVRDDK
jgi:secondary thiamine-phosphate synthase enzyme